LAGHGKDGRVLKRAFDRLNGTANKTAIGYLPTTDSLDTSGLDVKPTDLAEILSVDNPGWLEAVPQIRDHFATFGDRLPSELTTALNELESSLN
jgi:phosphoenolpyruvate carboxykinase (GTP)